MAAVSFPGLKFTGTASVRPACALAPLGPRPQRWSPTPPLERRMRRAAWGSTFGAPRAPGPAAIPEETKRLLPLIWFYRDLMLTLNFEYFYLFQSLSHSHFGRGFLGLRQSPRAGLGHRDQQVQRHEGAGGRGGGCAAGHSPYPHPPSRLEYTHPCPARAPRRSPQGRRGRPARGAGVMDRTRLPGGAGRRCRGTGRRRRASVLPPQPPNPC